MKETEFEKRVWDMFFYLCNKQNLDLKGDSIKDYRSNFESTFNKAYGVVMQYYKMKENIDMIPQDII